MAIIIHEAIHGYIDYHRNLVDYEYMTQEDFDNKFPLFTETINEGGTTSLAHHTEMAENFVNAMAITLMTYNETLTLQEATRLAWGGLEETLAWDLILTESEKNYIGLTDMAARGETAEGDSTTYNFINCE